VSTPKLVTNPPQGSGLVPQLVDQHWEELVRGKPGELIPVVALLQPVGQGLRRTKDGMHRTVTYEVVRLEPVHDSHDADQVVWQVTNAYEKRTSSHSGAQQQVMFAGPDEQRASLIRDLFEWADEEQVTEPDLNDRWLQYFGGSEHAASATPRAGSLVQLMEFGRYCGAIVDKPLKENDAEEDEPETEEEGTETEEDGDGDPDAQPAALHLADPFKTPEVDDEPADGDE